MCIRDRLIGIADVNERPGKRDVVVNGVPHTEILYPKMGHLPVFFGPKQAIIVNHDANVDIVFLLHGILTYVPQAIRNCIADEAILGLYALMIGQTRTPWFSIAYNAGPSRDICGKRLSAYAYYLLFKSLIKHGVHITGLNNYVQLIRYYLSWVL